MKIIILAAIAACAVIIIPNRSKKVIAECENQCEQDHYYCKAVCKDFRCYDECNDQLWQCEQDCHKDSQ